MATKKVAKPNKAIKATKTTKAKPTNTTRPARTTTVKKVVPVRKATKPNSPASALSPEQVGQVLELLKGANSIELKLSVPLASHRATIRAIGRPVPRSRGRRSSSIRPTLP